jgi:hypothetical protein
MSMVTEVTGSPVSHAGQPIEAQDLPSNAPGNTPPIFGREPRAGLVSFNEADDSTPASPEPNEGKDLVAVAHGQFSRLLGLVELEDSVRVSQKVLAAVVAQCQKGPGWKVSSEPAEKVAELKALIGTDEVIKNYVAAQIWPPTP